MGILSKLFGRKQKKEEQKPAGDKVAKQSEPTDEVSLEDVNESLEEVNTIRKDEPKQAPTESPSKETPKQAVSEKPQPSEDKPEETPEAEEAKAVYDIKKHPEGWQIIKEGAEKAYRVFEYQKEAIDFAKQEALEYKVFKADGTPRK